MYLVLKVDPSNTELLLQGFKLALDFALSTKNIGLEMNIGIHVRAVLPVWRESYDSFVARVVTTKDSSDEIPTIALDTPAYDHNQSDIG